MTDLAAIRAEFDEALAQLEALTAGIPDFTAAEVLAWIRFDGSRVARIRRWAAVRLHRLAALVGLLAAFRRRRVPAGSFSFLAALTYSLSRHAPPALQRREVVTV